MLKKIILEYQIFDCRVIQTCDITKTDYDIQFNDDIEPSVRQEVENFSKKVYKSLSGLFIILLTSFVGRNPDLLVIQIRKTLLSCFWHENTRQLKAIKLFDNDDQQIKPCFQNIGF